MDMAASLRAGSQNVCERLTLARFPPWILGASRVFRQALLDALLERALA